MFQKVIEDGFQVVYLRGLQDRNEPLFYALLVWCLCRGFVVMRGWRRRRKGRCGWRGGCGYDLSGSVGEVCPECGRPVGEGSRGDAAGAAAG